jgi:mono/diheme cytochrome c family protein
MASTRGNGLRRRRPRVMGRTLLHRGLMRLVVLAALAASGCREQNLDTSHLAALDVPAEHSEGLELFELYCSGCHGAQATGTDAGPPLVHPVYRTRHHGDEAFQLAVAQGVSGHHFRFGDMPAVPGPSREDVASITGYVRWLQRSAGIE